MDSIQNLLSQFSLLTMSLLIVIFALTAYFHGPVFSVHTAHNAPSILTSLGIFGTFLGVAIGLMNFDTDSIQASVPALIEGLKTAFWTSIAGILGALSIKFRFALTAIRRANKVSRQGATLEDVVDAVQLMSSQLTSAKNDNFADSMVASQTATRLSIESMSENLSQFQEQVTESITDSLIEAIKHVMQDFNAKIDQQYGDNFRELNESVGKMQKWQEGNITQLQGLINQQKESAEAMVHATEAFSTLVGQSHEFTRVAASMKDMLMGLQEQSGELGSFMERLAGLVTNAQTGLPNLEHRIEQLTTTLHSSVINSEEMLSSTLRVTSENIANTVETVNSTLASSVISSQHTVSDQLRELIELNRKQFVELDQTMEAELEKALKTFGYQLTALSEKFVNDYTPLTDKLHDLVSLAEQNHDS